MASIFKAITSKESRDAIAAAELREDARRRRERKERKAQKQSPLTDIPTGAKAVARIQGKPKRQPVKRLASLALSRIAQRQTRDALARSLEIHQVPRDHALELRISESEGRVEKRRVEQALSDPLHEESLVARVRALESIVAELQERLRASSSNCEP